jgi:hypothetical protein
MSYEKRPMRLVGKVFVRPLPLVATDPMIRIGNSTKMTLATNVNQDEVPDMEVGYGTWSTSSRINSVDVDITCKNWSIETLALALRGGTSTVALGSAVEHSITTPSSKDSYVKLPHENITAATIATFTEGVDFVLGHGSLYIPSGSTLAVDTAYTIALTYPATTVVDALIDTASSTYHYVYLEGENVITGQTVAVEFWKAEFQFPGNLELLHESQADLPLKLKLFPDSTKLTPADDSTSAFYRMIIGPMPS